MGNQKCRTCGVDFERKNGPARYCAAHRLTRREALARDQRERRKRLSNARPPIKCFLCGAYFKAMRSDAKWCPECKRPKQRPCQRCGVLGMPSRAKWCVECKPLAEKLRFERFEQKHQGRCLDCGKATSRRAERCRTCCDEYRRRSGDEKRENSVHWKGGKTRSRHGYIYIRDYTPGRVGHPYRPEHTVVWEQAHGKSLPKGWVIHHINGRKDDNRPENLLAVTRSGHQQIHHLSNEEAIRPYEQRIRQLEDELRSLKSDADTGP